MSIRPSNVLYKDTLGLHTPLFERVVTADERRQIQAANGRTFLLVNDTPAPAKPNPKPAVKPAAAPSQPATLGKPLTPAQASVAKGLDILSFTQEAYDALCKRCLGQLISFAALNDEQAASLHSELLAIYNSGRTQPAPEPAPETEVEIIDDQQAPIFDYGDDTDPNGGAA